MKELIRKMWYKIPFARRFSKWRYEAWPYYKMRIKNPRAVFLVMTPRHSNLGDHAIALAEINMLKKLGIKYIEIYGENVFLLYRQNRLRIFNGRNIIVNGGGNLGTLWYEVESSFRTIISKNKRSKILLCPNTIFYDDTEKDLAEKEESVRIYNSHKHLKLYAREKISCNIMKDLYKDVSLCPDMVLSLKKDDNQRERKGCLLCLRNDIEKTRTQSEEQVLIDNVNNIFGDDYSMTDMVVDEDVTMYNREEVLEKKFNQFKGAELVVTDRLHAMIFCAITATPCIVINSKSPKVKGCYEWIKDLEYIRFADSVKDIETIYNEIPKKVFHYDNSKFQHFYDDLMISLKSLSKRR